MGERQDRPRWVAKKRRVTTATVYFGLLFKPPPPTTSSHAQRPPPSSSLRLGDSRSTICYCLIDHTQHKFSLSHLSLFALPTDRPQKPRSASNLLHNRIQSLRYVRERVMIRRLSSSPILSRSIPIYFISSNRNCYRTSRCGLSVNRVSEFLQ